MRLVRAHVDRSYVKNLFWQAWLLFWEEDVILSDFLRQKSTMSLLMQNKSHIRAVISLVLTCLFCYQQGRGQEGAVAPPNHLTIHFLKHSKLNKKLMGEGCEVKRDDTTRNLWIHHLHKAGNSILEAPEFSIFLECYLPPVPPKSGVWLRPWLSVRLCI